MFLCILFNRDLRSRSKFVFTFSAILQSIVELEQKMYTGTHFTSSAIYSHKHTHTNITQMYGGVYSHAMGYLTDQIGDWQLSFVIEYVYLL